jgi:peptide/nickel transport system ATP-binding protein
MYAGHTVESAASIALMQAPAHPYTELLLAAIPNPQAGFATRTVQARGEVPSLVDPPPGCPFAARCPKVMDVCRQAMPAHDSRRGSLGPLPSLPIVFPERIVCFNLP